MFLRYHYTKFLTLFVVIGILSSCVSTNNVEDSTTYIAKDLLLAKHGFKCRYYEKNVHNKRYLNKDYENKYICTRLQHVSEKYRNKGITRIIEKISFSKDTPEYTKFNSKDVNTIKIYKEYKYDLYKKYHNDAYLALLQMYPIGSDYIELKNALRKQRFICIATSKNLLHCDRKNIGFIYFGSEELIVYVDFNPKNNKINDIRTYRVPTVKRFWKGVFRDAFGVDEIKESSRVIKQNLGSKKETK
mgnify:CR=1 FL=1